jgi:hypothetical protein
VETGLVEKEMLENGPEIALSKDLALLKIQANQNDPLIFQTLFCPICQAYILANGLFPAPAQHAPAHPLAWVPAVDEPVPGRPIQAISYWLQLAPLTTERRRYLAEVAPTSNSLCWGLIIEPPERENWFEFLANYLDELAEAWLAALNGSDTKYFRSSEIWLRPGRTLRFYWLNLTATD